MVLQHVEKQKILLSNESWLLNLACNAFFLWFGQWKNVVPVFKRVRVAKLVNSCYLKYSHNLCGIIGLSYAHEAVVIDEITAHVWYAMHSKSWNLHCLREGTSDELNQMYEELAFAKSLLGVH